jgi:hypothetical protein
MWHTSAESQPFMHMGSVTGSRSYDHVPVLTRHCCMYCSGAPPPLPAPKQPRQLSGEEQRAALAALRKELGLTGGPPRRTAYYCFLVTSK